MRGGGVEQGTLEIARALRESGHRALVVSAGGELVEGLQACGAEHLTWHIGRKSPLTLALVPRLRRLLLQQQVDVLHLRSRMPAWVGLLAWRSIAVAQRPRLVTTVHGFYSISRYSAVMIRGERVICVSDAIRRYVLESYPGVDATRLHTIHRGIDPQRFNPAYRAPRDWLARWRRDWPATGEPTLLLPGRLTRLKGHLVFLRLIQRLCAAGLPVRGLIAGGVDPRRRGYAREVAAAVVDLGLSDRVRLLGHRGDMRELMSVSDLVLSLSSQPESFGRTTLEALGLGRPVVGFDHGGVGEILHALYPGGAVPAGDEEALLRSVRRHLDHAPAPGSTHGFLLRRMTDSTLSLYRELLRSPRSA
jgi:glycosyltransferase involved in cell wall biosynthesis